MQSASAAPCKVHVVEDRSSRVWGALMSEVKLRASKYIDPADRRTMAESMATLNAWKPNLRVTGGLIANADENVSGAVRLVDLKTGKVIAGSGSGGQATSSRLRGVRREVDAALCKFPPRLRLAILETTRWRQGGLTVHVGLERDVRVPAGPA